MDKNYDQDSAQGNLKLLLVEDDEIFALSLQDALLDEGFEVTLAMSGEKALELLDKQDFSLVISDVNLPGKSGMDVLRKVKEKANYCKFIMITAYGNVEKAVKTMKAGADDYITKPFEMEEFFIRVRKLLNFQAKERELAQIGSWLNNDTVFMGIVGKSQKMKEIIEVIRTIADSDCNVLITGESGTGKELVANAIQQLSSRKNRAYVKINCAAIPANLLESELFGYEKGAFTGAVKKYSGKILAADGGTLLLDEIGDMDLNLQSKMLRIIEEKKLTPLGSSKEIKFDIRIIAATQKDLEAAVADNTFRRDLFYRLNIVHIKLPNLAERREDIPLMIDFILRKYSLKLQRKLEMTDALITFLQARDYPGNVRELENIIYSLIVMNQGESRLDESMIGKISKSNETQDHLFGLFDLNASYQEVISSFEKIYLSTVLARCQNKKNAAARQLQISRKNLWEKLKKHQIE